MPELHPSPQNTFPVDHQWQALFELVDLVADRQREDFGQIGSALKADGSLVTACDQWSDSTLAAGLARIEVGDGLLSEEGSTVVPVSYAHLRAHETKAKLVCRVLLEKKKHRGTARKQLARERGI